MNKLPSTINKGTLSLCCYTNFIVLSYRLRVFDLPQDSLDTDAIASTAADNLSVSYPPELTLGASGDPQSNEPSDSITSALKIQEGETIYGMAWYPGMNALDPASCCFATTSRVSSSVAEDVVLICCIHACLRHFLS